MTDTSNPRQTQNGMHAPAIQASDQSETLTQDSPDKHAQRLALAQRLLENDELLSALTELTLDNAGEKLELVHSFLKLTPPEQRETIRKNAVKAYPDEAEQIKAFFNRVNNAPDKTRKQIRSEEQQNKTDRETLTIMKQVVYNEFEQLMNDIKDYYGLTDL